MDKTSVEEGLLAEKVFEGEEEENLLFYCRCESAKSVSTLLSSLRQFAARVGGGHVSNCSTKTGEAAQPSLSVMVDHLSAVDGGRVNSSKKGIRSVQQVTVYAHPGGLTFHVHGIGRQSQASVDMQCGLFSEYTVATERIPTGVKAANADDECVNNDEGYENIVGGEFCVNLPTVIDSLHVLGLQNLDRTKVCLSYNLNDAIFKVELEDRGVLATTAICGSVPEFQYDDDDGDDPNYGRERGIATSSLAVAFRNHPVVARAIVKSDFFRSAVTELADISGAIICSVGISPDCIEIGTVGHSGECLVYLPKSSEAFTSLECNPPTLHMRSYHLYSLLQGMRGLDIAQETCMSINSNGMIAIQHQVLDVVGSSEANFIDFLMCAIQEDGDDHSQSSDDEPQAPLATKISSTDHRSSVANWNDPIAQPKHVYRRHGANQKAINTSLDGDDDDTSTTEDDSDECDGCQPATKYDKLETDTALSLRKSRRSSLLHPLRNNNIRNTRQSSSSKGTGTIPSRLIQHQEMNEEASENIRTAATSQREKPKRARRSSEGYDSPEIVFGSTRVSLNDNNYSPSNLFDNHNCRDKSNFRDKNESETEEEEFN